MRPGMPNPNALRGEISGMQKKHAEMETGAGKMEAQLTYYEQQRGKMIAAKQDAINKRNEYAAAMNKLPPGHPQREQIKAAIEAYDQRIAHIEEQLIKINQAIDQLRKNLRTMRERKSMLRTGINARKRYLVQLTAQMMKQKQQQKQQGNTARSRNKELGKQKG